MDPQRRPAWSPLFSAECAVAAHSRPTLSSMRSIFIAVSLLACSVCSLAGEDITGTWVTCYPKEDRPSPYMLSSIEREGRQYVVRDEWGLAYSFSGRATRVGGEIIV